MDPEQLNSMLKVAGVTTSQGDINYANIFANLIFGTIGFVVMMYGWKNKAPKPLVIGVALSAYSFFVPNAILNFAIGTALTALLYFWRD